MLIGAGPACAEKESPDERTLWRMEQSYWKYVQAGDLESYRKLWHPNFVDWPNSSARPKRKDHITDWTANYTKKGVTAGVIQTGICVSQATGNVVVTHYWITDRWVDKQGPDESETDRITHTWIRTPGSWQIIGRNVRYGYARKEIAGKPGARSGMWITRISALSRRGKAGLIHCADEDRTISQVISEMCFGGGGRYSDGKSAERFRRYWSRAIAGEV